MSEKHQQALRTAVFELEELIIDDADSMTVHIHSRLREIIGKLKKATDG